MTIASQEAVKPEVMVFGFVFCSGMYMLLSKFRLPILLVYGVVQGLGQVPHFVFPEMIGALLGRYVFQKRFGVKTWRQYTPVLFAGFACGMGLIGMAVVAIVLISKSILQLPY